MAAWLFGVLFTDCPCFFWTTLLQLFSPSYLLCLLLSCSIHHPSIYRFRPEFWSLISIYPFPKFAALSFIVPRLTLSFSEKWSADIGVCLSPHSRLIHFSKYSRSLDPCLYPMVAMFHLQTVCSFIFSKITYRQTLWSMLISLHRWKEKKNPKYLTTTNQTKQSTPSHMMGPWGVCEWGAWSIKFEGTLRCNICTHISSDVNLTRYSFFFCFIYKAIPLWNSSSTRSSDWLPGCPLLFKV